MLFFFVAHAAEPCGPTGCPAPTGVDTHSSTALALPTAAKHLRTATFALG